MMEMWKPEVVEESLAVIGWPKHSCTDDPENQVFIAYFHTIIVFFSCLIFNTIFRRCRLSYVSQNSWACSILIQTVIHLTPLRVPVLRKHRQLLTSRHSHLVHIYVQVTVRNSTRIWTNIVVSCSSTTIISIVKNGIDWTIRSDQSVHRRSRNWTILTVFRSIRKERGMVALGTILKVPPPWSRFRIAVLWKVWVGWTRKRYNTIFI